MKNEKISELNSVLQPRRNRRFLSQEARKTIVKELESGQIEKYIANWKSYQRTTVEIKVIE